MTLATLLYQKADLKMTRHVQVDNDKMLCGRMVDRDHVWFYDTGERAKVCQVCRSEAEVHNFVVLEADAGRYKQRRKG